MVRLGKSDPASAKFWPKAAEYGLLCDYFFKEGNFERWLGNGHFMFRLYPAAIYKYLSTEGNIPSREEYLKIYGKEFKGAREFVVSTLKGKELGPLVNW